MAFASRFSPLTPALTLALVAGLACGPKLDSDDGGDGSSAAGTTTTGEAVTSSDGDPTTPTGVSTATSPGSGGSDTASGSATAASTTGMATTDDPGTATLTSTSTGTSATATSDTSEPPPAEPPVPCEGEAKPLVGVASIAYLKAQIPRDPNPSGTGTSGGGESDPATLYVRLGDQKPLCEAPNKSIECGLHWDMTIVIPPEFQAPGLFNLLGQDVFATASESGPENGDECSFGVGSFPATLEILAVDDDAITGRLCHVESFLSVDVDLEGSFVAPRCP